VLLLLEPLELSLKLRLHLLQRDVRVLTGSMLHHWLTLSTVRVRRHWVASHTAHWHPCRWDGGSRHRAAAHLTDALQLVHHPLVLALHLMQGLLLSHWSTVGTWVLTRHTGPGCGVVWSAVAEHLHLARFEAVEILPGTRTRAGSRTLSVRRHKTIGYQARQRT
jgi:hypothetical protein